MDLIKVAEEAFATGKKFPEFKAGDTITVAYKIIEGSRALRSTRLVRFVALSFTICASSLVRLPVSRRSVAPSPLSNQPFEKIKREAFSEVLLFFVVVLIGAHITVECFLE